MLEFKENIKNVKEFQYLYNEVGWGAYDEKISEISLSNTFYSISVYDGNNIAGFGRIIGDEICFLYIQDIMVLPKYQSNGIGTMIIEKLLLKIEEVKKNNSSVRVYVGASIRKRRIL